MDTTKSNKQYLYLNGRMDYEMVNSFLNFYNSLSSETNEVTIYLNSEGGIYDVMQILLDIINHSKVKITLVAVGYIMSCAFLLFYLAKCNKILMSNCYGCVHTISSSFELRDKKFEGDIIRLNEINDINKKIEHNFKSFLTKEESKKFKDGEDVYLSSKRMKEIFN